MREYFIASGLLSTLLGVSLIRSRYLLKPNKSIIIGIFITIAGIFIILTGLFLLV